jgi:hypothetical protein
MNRSWSLSSAGWSTIIRGVYQVTGQDPWRNTELDISLTAVGPTRFLDVLLAAALKISGMD